MQAVRLKRLFHGDINLQKRGDFMKKRKKSNKRQKRTTFARLFAKSGALALAISLVFSYAVFEFGVVYLDSLVNQAISECGATLASRISSLDNDNTKSSKQKEIYMDVSFSFASFVLSPMDLCVINSGYDEGCNGSAALFDSKGNVIASSKQKLMLYICFAEDDEYNGYYICDRDKLDYPEVEQLYSVVNEFSQNTVGKDDLYCDFYIDSAYVDKENYLFVPKNGKIELRCEEYAGNTELLETAELNVQIDDSSFEVVEFASVMNGFQYPRVTTYNLRGTDAKVFDEQFPKLVPNVMEFYEGSSQSISFGRSGYEFAGANYYLEQPVYYGGEELVLSVGFEVDYTTPKIRTLYLAIIITFTAVSMLIALLWSWRRNVINKANYAFEDYQKNLINNLAHDIKTPLTAIGGYAENLIRLHQSGDDEKTEDYLNAIMENVAYTDSIVNKTLELNRISEITKVNKTQIDVNKAVNECVSKYKLLLEGKGISLNVSGNAAVNADSDTFLTAVENLVSNAVKYTPDGGIITIEIDDKRLKISNEVFESVDVKNITMPFVKGDKARSGKNGSGLGLSIAKSAAAANGFELLVDCSEKIFTAEIVF